MAILLRLICLAGALLCAWGVLGQTEEQQQQALLNWLEASEDQRVAMSSNGLSICDLCDSRCKPKCGTRHFHRCCYRYMRRKKAGASSLPPSPLSLEFLDGPWFAGAN